MGGSKRMEGGKEMIFNYILGFMTGWLICDIFRDVKTRIREYPLQEAMQEQQIRFKEK